MLARLGSCLGSPSRTVMTDQADESWNHAAASPQKSPSGSVRNRGKQTCGGGNLGNRHLQLCRQLRRPFILSGPWECKTAQRWPAHKVPSVSFTSEGL